MAYNSEYIFHHKNTQIGSLKKITNVIKDLFNQLVIHLNGYDQSVNSIVTDDNNVITSITDQINGFGLGYASTTYFPSSINTHNAIFFDTSYIAFFTTVYTTILDSDRKFIIFMVIENLNIDNDNNFRLLSVGNGAGDPYLALYGGTIVSNYGGINSDPFPFDRTDGKQSIIVYSHEYVGTNNISKLWHYDLQTGNLLNSNVFELDDANVLYPANGDGKLFISYSGCSFILGEYKFYKGDFNDNQRNTAVTNLRIKWL